MSAVLEIVLGGLFHAAVLFLVAAGLQLVFGVQKIVNLACGAFYALGAYVGVSVAKWAGQLGVPQPLLLLALLAGGLAAAAVGPPIERLLRTVYDRDESFQLLLTFALLLIFQDLFRIVWGANPQTLGMLYLSFGTLNLGIVRAPTYNVLVIGAAITIATGLGWFLQKTRFGRLLRATAENRAMAEALGVDVRAMFAIVFTLGVALGTVGGALVVPSSAASLDMAAELVVEAFAVVVIGGLGSMRGALWGAVIVGLIRAAAVTLYAEFELLAIYTIVIAVLLLKPAGLFGRETA